MLLVSLVVVFSLQTSYCIRTKRSLERKKRSDPCSFQNLFTMEKKKDNEYNFVPSPGLVDRLMVHNFDYDRVCNGNKLFELEAANRIYVLNNQDTSRAKRSTDGEKTRQRRSLGDQEKHMKEAKATGIARSKPVDKVRLIERIAVEIDLLEKHMHQAAQILDSQKVKVDRQMFSIYKERMRSLLKTKLKLVIKENKIMLNSMENINISKHFQR